LFFLFLKFFYYSLHLSLFDVMGRSLLFQLYFEGKDLLEKLLVLLLIRFRNIPLFIELGIEYSTITLKLYASSTLRSSSISSQSSWSFSICTYKGSNVP
jgi:hypothetical protein